MSNEKNSDPIDPEVRSNLGNPGASINIMDAILGAEKKRRDDFSLVIKITLGIAIVLLIVLTVFVHKVLKSNAFDWHILSILGVIYALPASAIIITLIHALKTPYNTNRNIQNTDENQKNQDNIIDAMPSTVIIDSTGKFFQSIKNMFFSNKKPTK